MVSSEEYVYFFKDNKFKKYAVIFKGALLVFLGVLYFNDNTETLGRISGNKTSWFTNIQTVESFETTNDTLSTKESRDAHRWKKVIFNGYSYYPETFQIVKENGRRKLYSFEIDSLQKIIRYKPLREKDSEWSLLEYENVEGKKYQFKGIFEGDTININTKMKTAEDFRLIRRKGKFLID